MSNDSRFVLAQLTRTTIWSRWQDLLQYRYMVLEADSIITHLCRYCVNRHISRQRRLLTRSKSLPSALDYNSATLINYGELAHLIELLLDYFGRIGIELIIVYRGKHMEAPLFGLGPAQYKKNTQRTSECLLAMLQHEASIERTSASHGAESEHKTTLDRMRPTRPNLALILFKMIVNSRMAAASKPAIQTHQAFYCPYPTCARLARDYKCPVMTNDGDFIVMDVRAGFIMFEEFLISQLLSSDTMARISSGGSTSPLEHIHSVTSVNSNSSIARNQLAVGPAGRCLKPPASKSMIELTGSRSPFQNRHSLHSESTTSSRRGGTKSPKSPRHAPPPQIIVRFHFHRLFLRQHPGLNHMLALQLFPLTSGEFLTRYAKSLVRLRIYQREYREKDLIVATGDQKCFKKYHQAAARLELVMRYLCAKDSNVVPQIVRGEAIRLKCAIERDYQGLYDYYAVSYHFKGRLRLVMRKKNMLDLDQANHIEFCLLRRECTADFWLSLLCCALGQLAAIDYNKTMQFEDLQTKHSARSMLDLPKCLMMCVLGGDNRLHRCALSCATTSDQRQQLESRFPTASLTVVDRQGRKLVERTVSGVVNSSDTHTLNQRQQAVFDQIREHLTLGQLAKHNAKPEAASLLNLIFNSSDMTNLSNVINPRGAPHLHLELLKEPSHSLASKRLAVMLSLHRYSLHQAARDDQYFKQNYLGLGQHFETGLINLHLFQIHHESSGSSKTSRTSLSSTTSVRHDLRQLFDLVHRFDLERVTNYRGLAMVFESTSHDEASKSNKTIKSNASLAAAQLKEKRKSGSSNGSMESAGKQIRHLIELFEGAIEAYCELNAFLNHPLPQLSLRHYNPVLLFNLTLISQLLE